MSATLARKLRRIGLTRMARTETVITKDEQGNDTEATLTHYHTRRIQYSPEELTQKRAEIITAWRAKRKRQK
jgi:hypothetical protein